MFNIEKLQTMSRQELAEFFASLVCHDCATTFQCEECHPDDAGCANEISKWLDKECCYDTLVMVDSDGSY